MIRHGEHTGPTSGLARGYVQGNLAIFPGALAVDFLEFCRLNPKPCPLLASSAPGDWRLPELADDLDIRTDLPRYRVWRNGRIADEPNDVRDWWRDDLVAFVLGCSFSFEEALLEHGIELRHITCGCAVPMYRTSIATAAAGPFHGPWWFRAPAQSRRCGARESDNGALSTRAWRTGPRRRAGSNRHWRPRGARLWRSGARS
jgi:uncharacterized protein YcsI (UPF0317 family)